MLYTGTALPMNNSTFPPSLHTQRRSSRTHSISSSITVKPKASSGATQGGHEPPPPPPPPSAGFRRGSPTHDQTANDIGVNDGMGNLNRWSQSTTSSTGGSPAQLSTAQSQANGSVRARRNVAASPAPGTSSAEASPRQRAQQGRASPASSPNLQRRRDPALEKPLPPAIPPLSFAQIPLTADATIESEPLLTADSYTSASASLLTPSSYSANDYFGGASPVDGDMAKDGPTPTTDRPAQSSLGRSRYSTQHGMQQIGEAVSPSEPAPKKSRSRDPREKDKKTMLSKALEKANTAVLLDNAMNYEGAFNAYEDACRLLTSVMERTSGSDDKRKLDAIRDTYASRIEELLLLQPSTQSPSQGKRLPPRPTSNESLEFGAPPSHITDALSVAPELPVVENATLTKIVDIPAAKQLPRNSFLTDAIREVEGASSGGFLGPLWERERSKSLEKSDIGDSMLRNVVPHDEDLDRTIMPRPLTPRTTAPSPPAEPESPAQGEELQTTATEAAEVRELPANGGDTVSWLDTIDESGSSDTSSVHSRSSQLEVHRKPIASVIGESGKEFDEAFDAAVEAAYEDDFEPDEDYAASSTTAETIGHVSTVPVDAIPTTLLPQSYQAPLYADDELDEEAEEERILDDITNDYLDQGFDFDMQSKSALPRQSDSSAYSRSTWQSSNVSNRTTAATSLSTVAEHGIPRVQVKEPQHSPSLSNLTYTPSTIPTVSEHLVFNDDLTTNAADRRSTGPNLNFKNLKIETSANPIGQRQMVPDSEGLQVHDTDSSDPFSPISDVPSLQQPHSTLLSPPDTLSAASDANTTFTTDGSLPPDSADLTNGNPSPKSRLFGRKKKSLLSLRDHGGAIQEEPVPALPLTPLSASFMPPPTLNGDVQTNSRRAQIIPSAGSIPAVHDGIASGGSYLFDTSIVTTTFPSSPRSQNSNSPSPLEPCPEPHLLRPFWLMRCVASTITHPKGGFLTTRLFVPHEVWLNRSVKLKNIEEKIACCDLLTAALGKLSGVNTYDADAVLEELQSFEEVMERVQVTLVKKLGSEVGVQGVGALFKDATTTDGPSTGADSAREAGPKTNSGKSYLSGWRKLRSKNSSFGSAGAVASGRVERDGPMMATVPMTSFVTVDNNKTHKIDLTHDVAADGPHRDYMISLARLCEAAQVLDQVARQVEDPGLKHSSPTHIGLELSTRHAAEFFGFYICRFMLTDLGMLIDKFVKRGTEWVLV
ncbi:hypothetical protein MBLNU459_g1753t1 [Dothideomycetes sp. NU459]